LKSSSGLLLDFEVACCDFISLQTARSPKAK
jgi:hypothetical protein